MEEISNFIKKYYSSMQEEIINKAINEFYEDFKWLEAT
jgi:hypothetical protein